jgi:hypothetical protein
LHCAGNSSKVLAAAPRLDYDAAAFYRDADLCAGLQVQDIEQGSGNGQHDGTADFAQICGVHQSLTLFEEAA